MVSPPQVIGKADGQFDMLVTWGDSRNDASGSSFDIYGVITHAATPVAQPIIPPTPPPAQPIPGVDLTVGAFAMAPAILKTGTAISIDATIRNDGTQAAGPFEVRYYWATGLPVTGGTVLYTQTFPSGLGASGSLKQSFAVTPPAGTDGTYYLGIVVDAAVPDQVVEANEDNNLSVFALSVDNGPPTTGILYPRPTDILRGTVPVLASAEDATGVVYIQFYLDGSAAYLDIGGPNDGWVWAWDTTKATNGPHTLFAKAFDAAGNVGISSTVTVLVDNAAPIISAVTSSGVTGSSATITWTTNEPADSQVEYGPTTSYGSSTLLDVTLVTAHSLALSGLTATTMYHYRVKSADVVGNPATSPDFTFTTPDITPPSGTVSINSGAAVTNTTAVTLALTCTDNVGCTQVQVAGDGMADTEAFVAYATSAAATLPSGDGTKTVAVKFKDGAGNVSVQVTDTIVLDSTPPIISAVTAGSITASGATITWTTDEPADSRVEYGLTTAYEIAQMIDSASVTSHSLTLSGLNEGRTYYFRVTSRDAAGNAATATGTFSIPDVTPPTIPTNVGAIAASNVQQVTLTWTASQDNAWVSGYQVERCQDAGCTNFTPLLTTSQTGYSDAGLTPGATYRYRLQAMDPSENRSGYSAVATTTTAATPAPTPPWVVSQAWSAQYNGPANGTDLVSGSRKLTTDSAGNVYVTGQSANGTNADYVTVKYSPSGAQLWVARYDSGATDWPRAEFVDQAGNVYVSGTTCPTSDCNTDPNPDYLTVKYNANGTLLWAARYNNGGLDYAGIVKVDGAGNVYVTGQSSNGVNADYATIKYDANGNQLWVARYDGGGDDFAAVLAVDSTGNAYVTGSTCSGANCANRDYATIKYSPAGSQLWMARYDYGPADFPTTLAIDAAANIYITGMSQGTNGYDYATVKYNSAGTQLWAARYDGGSADYALPLAVDDAGNVYVSGTSYTGINTDLTTVKYSPSGAQLWVMRYDGGSYDDIAYLAVDPVGNAYVMGYSETTFSYLIIKYDSNGNQLWTSPVAGVAATLWVDSAQSVYVAGTIANTDFLTVKFTQDTAPPIVSGVTVGSITTAGATIAWTTDEPADSQVDYGTTTEYGSSTAVNPTPVTSHAVGLTGLSEATLYHYRVRSRDQAGNMAVSGDFTFTPDGTPPNPPSNLLATPVSGSQITLAWSASPGDNVGVSGYDIERCQGSGCSGLVVIASVTTTTYSNTGLTLGASYSYRVRAVDAAGNRSAPSNVATVTSSANLVGNPSFEVDTSGWAGYGSATIARVAGGYDGAYALEMRGPATTAAFGVNDSPNNWVVSTPGVGVRYRFTAWVRSAANTGQAKLQVREYLSGVKQGATVTSAAVGLTPTWQSVTVDYVSLAAGSTLDFQVLDTPVVAGEVFQTDLVSIYLITVSSANQPPNGVIDTPAGNVTIGPGQGVNFTATGTDPDGHLPLSYTWNFGGGAANQNVEDPGAVVFNAIGTYTVTLTVTDSLGVADPTPDSRVITVTVPNQPPTASLTVTPSTGNAPLSVTANASASIDPDGTIASYRFDFGDGTVVGPQTAATATHTYAAGAWTASVTVTDNIGATSTASAPIIVAAVGSGTNLVGNPSFEVDTSGWAAYSGSTIQRVAGGFDGAYTLGVTGPSTTATFGVNDSPNNWVASTSAVGVRYRFTAWVRSASNTGQVKLQVREYLNGTKQGATVTSAAVGLTPGWQSVTVDYVSLTAGSTLDFQVLDTPVVAGEVFQTDNISIRVVP
ncbi:MAG: fibronectin type III domain-containing protein [Nitrospirae bacterium]|nr:fibronectin type III domain-containing protein [Nitrospirota bacterium]